MVMAEVEVLREINDDEGAAVLTTVGSDFCIMLLNVPFNLTHLANFYACF